MYRHDEVPEKPWSIHILKIERARNDLAFHTTSAAGGEPCCMPGSHGPAA